MRNLGLDFRYAFRRLWSTPLFTAFAVVSLALGIGATTAIYSAAYELVLRPAVIGDADRVVDLYHREPRVGETSGGEARFSLLDLDDLRTEQRSFSHLTAWSSFGGPVATEDRAEVLVGEIVDGEYFDVAGVHPALGRLIQSADNVIGAPPVAVISYAFWERWFGGDPTVIGRRFRVGEDTFEIVGVTEADFRGVANPSIRPTPFWVPLLPQLNDEPRSASLIRDRNAALVNVKGQLKAGVSLDASRADVKRVALMVDRQSPITWDRNTRRLQGPRQWFVTPTVRTFSTGASFAVSLVAVLMGAVGLVLLVACTNLANLMLARASRRRHEFAVRMALGASRWRLIREQLVEGLILAIAGGAAGLLVASLGMTWLRGSAQILGGFYVYLEPSFNPAVVSVAVAATVLTMLVFSLVPAFHTTRSSVEGAMRADGGTTSMRWRGRRLLITAQVIVSTLLITVAFLAVQQLHSVANRDLGVDLDRLAAVSMNFEYSHYDETRARLLLDETVEKARRAPGIEKAAIASGFPLNPGGNTRVGSETKEKGAALIVGTPEMFSVFGTKLKHGRFLNETDTASNVPTAVVSEGVVRQLFPDGEALGRQVTLTAPSFKPHETEVVMIVGVVAEPDGAAIGKLSNGYVFRPWAQRYEHSVSLVVRTNDPVSQIDTLRRLVREAGRDLVISGAIAGPAITLAMNLAPRIVSIVAGLLGVIALILSLIGLYGVLGHMVAGRTREVGVRIALGADRRQIMRMILMQGLDPVISGLVLGLLLGAAARSAFQPLIVQYFPAFDPLVFVLVPIPFAVAAALACYIPARRASRVNPLVALRQD